MLSSLNVSRSAMVIARDFRETMFPLAINKSTERAAANIAFHRHRLKNLSASLRYALR